jgi:hypothetical protein
MATATPGGLIDDLDEHGRVVLYRLARRIGLEIERELGRLAATFRNNAASAPGRFGSPRPAPPRYRRLVLRALDRPPRLWRQRRKSRLKRRVIRGPSY